MLHIFKKYRKCTLHFFTNLKIASQNAKCEVLIWTLKSTNIFASENLLPMNESIAYNYHKLKSNGLIHSCFSQDGFIRIKHEERARPVKILHMVKLQQFFPDFDFGDADEDHDIFLDNSRVANDSTQYSY